jgi:hypothetical protein
MPEEIGRVSDGRAQTKRKDREYDTDLDGGNDYSLRHDLPVLQDGCVKFSAAIAGPEANDKSGYGGTFMAFDRFAGRQGKACPCLYSLRDTIGLLIFPEAAKVAARGCITRLDQSPTGSNLNK